MKNYQNISSQNDIALLANSMRTRGNVEFNGDICKADIRSIIQGGPFNIWNWNRL